MSSHVGEVLAALGTCFDSLGVRWYLFGAQAAIFHGVARLTADVDVTVLPEPHSTGRLASVMEANGFRLRVTATDDFVARTRVLKTGWRRRLQSRAWATMVTALVWTPRRPAGGSAAHGPDGVPVLAEARLQLRDPRLGGPPCGRFLPARSRLPSGPKLGGLPCGGLLSARRMLLRVAE